MEVPDAVSALPYPLKTIIQLVLESGNLTFEDEREVRHQIATIKIRKSWRSSNITLLASMASFSAGVFFNSDSIYSGALKFVGIVGFGVFATEKMSDLFSVLQVRELLKLLRDYRDLTRTLTRWIRDNEVTQRGYLVNKMGAERRVKTVGTCGQLRKTSFLEFRRIFMVVRNFTSELISDKPQGLDLICRIPLVEFGDSLSVSDADLETLSNSTDGFSLPAIKSLIGLLDLQISEFLRIFSTTLLTSGYFVLSGKLYRHRKKIEGFLQTVKREYEFETNIGAIMKDDRKREENALGRPEVLRSLELHLVAALVSVRKVGDCFGGTGNGDLDGFDEELMERLGYHVKCTELLLSRIKRKSVIALASPSGDTDVSPTKSDFELREVVSSDQISPVEDDIFEAVIQEDPGTQAFYYNADTERNHYTDQKLQSQVILEEIRTVLSLRSADWKERENRARERKGLPLLADSDEGQDGTLVPEAETGTSALDYVSDGSGSPEVDVPCERGSIFNPSVFAADAAALSAKWNSGREEHFGSEENDE